MKTHEEEIKIVRTVAKNLSGEWSLNELLTSINNIVIYNKKGLYIVIKDVYGSDLKQWSLKIKSTLYYDNFCQIKRIGCSIDKNYRNIATDLKKRLLSSESEAYEKMNKQSQEKKEKEKFLEIRKYVINSLTKVLKIKKIKNTHNSYEITTNDNARRVYIEHVYNKEDNFDINIRGLSSEKIIKIMGLIESN